MELESEKLIQCRVMKALIDLKSNENKILFRFYMNE
jgi:hypothetical protein